MKFYYSVVGMIALIMATQGVFAQGQRRPGTTDRPAQLERLERFKKMRLIEVLKLNEEESVRFFAKQSAHEDKIRELMKSRNEALDGIQDNVRDSTDGKQMQKLADNVIDLDQKIFAERQRYQNELRSSLTPEQFGKFLVFERNFEHHMREAVEDMIQKRSSRDREW